jgi:suppressor for copper-sensitivity B
VAQYRCLQARNSPLVRAIFVFFIFLISLSQSFADEGVDFELRAGRYVPGAETAYAGLSLSMDEGWHVYWKSPGEGGLPPDFKVTSARNLSSLDVEWPIPSEYETNGAVSFGYGGAVVIPLKLTPTSSDQPIFMDLELTMYGCSNICVPFHQKLSVVVTPDGSPDAIKQTDDWLTSVPVLTEQTRIAGFLSLDGRDLTMDVSGLGVGQGKPVLDLGRDFAAKLVNVDKDSIAHFDVRKVSDRTLSISDSAFLMVRSEGDQARSYKVDLTTPVNSGFSITIVLIALGAGLILNVMPCVLPVLAIKLSGLTKDHVERRSGFIWTGIGIVASFLFIAVGLLALKAAGHALGWGIQFQNPIFLGVMAILTMIFALSMVDGFIIRLPYRLTDSLLAFGSGSGRAASFFQGLVATLLATPCSAPLVGTAIGFAFTAGISEMLVIFFAMGFGMALPYFVIALLPASKSILPKSGHWMGKMKVLLAMGLVVTSGSLLGYLAISLPLVSGLIALTMVAFTFAIVSSKRLAALIILVMLITVAFTYPFTSREEAIRWRDFQVSDISKLVDDGKIVVVDVTAAWCITCKVNEAVAFSNSSVVQRLADVDVIPMRADWTVENPEISAYLKTFGRYGIPFTVVYSKEKPKGQVLPELLTPGTLLDAL